LKHRVEDLILGVPDVMPTILGLAGMEDKIPVEVQGVNYADILINSESGKIDKPKSALYIDGKSRGVYTGDQTMVVVNTSDNGTEVFGYDNINDPEQLNRIPFKEIENAQELKAELERLLKTTGDKWYTEKICSDFLSY
ncbi:MAG: hypothetical protein R3182_08785, partial [Draconibacterium sp.]|nr:hypothetical protein [Draconibacterium sp.]